MRTGAMGLGRIDAFHAETLAGLDTVESMKDSIAVGPEDKVPLRSVEPGTIFPAGTQHTFFMDRFTDACTLPLHEHRPVRREEVRA